MSTGRLAIDTAMGHEAALFQRDRKGSSAPAGRAEVPTLTALLHAPLALPPFAKGNQATAGIWIVMGMASDASAIN